MREVCTGLSDLERDLGLCTAITFVITWMGWGSGYVQGQGLELGLDLDLLRGLGLGVPNARHEVQFGSPRQVSEG